MDIITLGMRKASHMVMSKPLTETEMVEIVTKMTGSKLSVKKSKKKEPTLMNDEDDRKPSATPDTSPETEVDQTIRPAEQHEVANILADLRHIIDDEVGHEEIDPCLYNIPLEKYGGGLIFKCIWNNHSLGHC